MLVLAATAFEVDTGADPHPIEINRTPKTVRDMKNFINFSINQTSKWQ